MIRKLLVVFIAALLIASMSTSFAQFNEEGPSKFGVKLMNFIPMDSFLKNLNSIWIGPALDWNLKYDEDEKLLSYLTLCIMSSGDGSNKASVTFVSYTKLNRTPISDTRSRYTGVGIGLYDLKYQGIVYNSNTLDYEDYSVQSYKPGIHLLYGQEFKDTYFAEIEVNLMQGWEGVNWGGVFLNIGIKL